MPVDSGEVAAEQVPHLPVQLADHLEQAGAALLHVLHLRFEGVVAGADLGVFLHRPHVDSAKGPYPAAHLGHLRAQRGHGGVLDAEPRRVGGGQLIFVPELGGQLVVLALGGAFPLGQAGHLPAGFLPALGGVPGGGLRFRLGSLLFHPGVGGPADGPLLLPDAGPAALGLFLHVPDLLLQLRVLVFQRADGFGQAVLMGAGVCQPFFPVGHPAAAQLGVLFAGQLFQPLFGQLMGQLGLLRRKAVPAFGQAGQLAGQTPGLSGGGLPVTGGLAGGFFLPLGLGGEVFGLGGPLPGGLFGLGGGLIQPPALGFGPQAVLGGGPRFALGGGHVGGDGVGLRLALGRFLGGGGLVPLQGGDLFFQIADLLPAGEQPGRPLHAAAGEAAPRVDHLAVHGDHPVAVAEGFGHPAGLVDVLHHRDAAQKVRDDVLVAVVRPHQAAGQPGGQGQLPPEQPRLHGVQRQEGGAAGVLPPQQGDGGFGGGLAFHHDVLHGGPEGGLHRQLAAGFHRQNG